MYSVLVSLALGLVVFLGIGAWLGPVAGVVPGLLLAGGVFLALMWQLGKRVRVEMEGILPLLEARKVAEAKAYLRKLQDRYASWQPFLRGQIEVQIGMIDYIRLRFDEALPQLEAGAWRNWLAQLCIGAIHYRKGRKEQAWEAMEKARAASRKEPMVYTVWAVLLTRDGERDKALEVLRDGLKVLPDHKTLMELRGRVANKKRIDTRRLPEQWTQIFPEEVVQEHLIRGRAKARNPTLQAGHRKQRRRR